MHLSFVPVLINVRVLLSLLLLRRIRDGSAPTFAHDLRCQGIKSRAVMEHSAHWSRQLVCVLKRWEGSGVPVGKWRSVMLNSLVTTRLRGGAACLFPSRSATLVTPLPLLLLSMWCGSICLSVHHHTLREKPEAGSIWCQSHWSIFAYLFASRSTLHEQTNHEEIINKYSSPSQTQFQHLIIQ
jgi:hypothetical protein